MTSIPSGRLRWQIDIERRVGSEDAMGGESGTWGVLASKLRAQMEPIKDGEKVAAAQAGSQVSTRFRIRWAERFDDLDTDDRLWLRRPSRLPLLYNIVGVKPVGFRKILEITANAQPDTTDRPAGMPWLPSPSGAPVYVPGIGPSGQIVVIPWVIDGGGVPIQAGVKGHINLDFDCVILGWTMLADKVGSTTLDIWRSTYTQFDPALPRPGPGDSIVGSSPPAIVAAEKAQAVATGWSNGLHKDDVLAIVVASASIHQRVTLGLRLQKV